MQNHIKCNINSESKTVLVINTSDIRAGYCTWIGTGVTETIVLRDSIRELVPGLKQLYTKFGQPTSIFVVLKPGSYTGTRIGWCVAQIMAHRWQCKIWSGRDISTPDNHNPLHGFIYPGAQFNLCKIPLESGRSVALVAQNE